MDTNKSAFPQYVINNGGAYVEGGMTLRDYFAAKAMQSMNSRPDYEDAHADAIALDAYALADAMMKAREA